MSETRHNSSWMDEHVSILQRACRSIEGQRAKGVAVRRAVMRPARNLKGRCYRLAPARRIRLGRKALIENYYRWKKSGKSPEALRPRYQAHGPRIPAALVSAYVHTCALPGVDSLNAGFQKLKQLWRDDEVKRPFKFRRSVELPFSRATYQRALSAEKRRAIIDFQLTRIAAEVAENRFKQLCSPD